MTKWINIDGYGSEYYQINKRTLDIRSVDRTVPSRGGGKRIMKGRVLRQVKDARGYLIVCLSVDGVIKNKKVHRIIANAFIANPENKLEINHINGIKDDNRLENLEWATSSENQLHAFRTGLQIPKSGMENPMYGKIGVDNPNYGRKTGKNAPNARLVLNTNNGIFYESAKEAAFSFNMMAATLVNVLLGYRKNNTPFIYV